MDNDIRALRDEALANYDSHLAAICEIAIWGKVQVGTFEELTRASKNNLATSYGIGFDGTTQLASADSLAAAVCRKIISQRPQE